MKSLQFFIIQVYKCFDANFYAYSRPYSNMLYYCTTGLDLDLVLFVLIRHTVWKLARIPDLFSGLRGPVGTVGYIMHIQYTYKSYMYTPEAFLFSFTPIVKGTVSQVFLNPRFFTILTRLNYFFTC